ncbi:MAG: hypothetical protein V4760_08710 [Bdellovibrionota bacterium]
MPGGPDGSAFVGRSERWCYREHWSPVGSIFAYNADFEEARPELAFIVEPDQTLIHGSIAGGRFSVHRLHAIGFSPFSVPVREPHHVFGEENPRAGDPRFSASVEAAEKLLIANAPAAVANVKVELGTFSGSVPDKALPFRGYLWKTKDLPLGSAMAKLDSFARARGRRSSAFAWERDSHAYRGVSWSGHCNGWAASSVLRAEPQIARYDAKSKTTFLVSDQKGLLAERDYCVSYSFYGRRFPNGILEDITPGQFHQVVTYTIGTLKKPVALDLVRSRAIQNNVLSNYRSTIARTAENQFLVTTEVRNHFYDTAINELVGRAPSKVLTYRYSLTTDSRGNITGGKWINTNPDFLWVPLSGARCTDENPYLTDTILAEIAKLPEATP